MASKGAKQPRRRHAPDALVPNEGSLALLFDVRRRIIQPKRDLVTDSGEALRRMRSGDEAIHDLASPEPPAPR